MKKLFALSVAALVALGACNDVAPVVGPDGANFELVDVTQRLASGSVNAHVYGSFALQFTEVVGTPGGWGAIASGPANFPGNPKNAGTCEDGAWVNPRGQKTSGTMAKPHPHCVGPTGGTQEVIVNVVLEPISARYETFGDAGQRLVLGATAGDCDEDSVVGICGFTTGNGRSSRGVGEVVAYAIDQSTLGTTNRRVGTLTFNLDQYHANNTNYFEEDCSIGEDETDPRCINHILEATYAPLAEGGVGVETPEVTGFLYWSPATAPFNY